MVRQKNDKATTRGSGSPLSLEILYSPSNPFTSLWLQKIISNRLVTQVFVQMLHSLRLFFDSHSLRIFVELHALVYGTMIYL